MKRRPTGLPLALAVVSFGACTFPDYDVTSSAGTEGPTSSSGTPTSSSGSIASTTSSEASSGDASTASGTGGMGGMGGAMATSSGLTTTSSSSTASSSSTGAAPIVCLDMPCVTGAEPGCVTTCVGATPNDCDCDGDGAHRDAPECAGMAGAIDCYDCNANAKPGQTAFFFKPRGDASYDFDCNDAEEPKYTTTCPAVTPCSSGKVYNTFQSCGNAASLYDCSGILSMCSKGTTFTPGAAQLCR